MIGNFWTVCVSLWFRTHCRRFSKKFIRTDAFTVPIPSQFEVVLRPLASSSRVGDFSVVGGHEQLTFQCNQNVQYESELSLFASV